MDYSEYIPETRGKLRLKLTRWHQKNEARNWAMICFVGLIVLPVALPFLLAK